MWTRSTNLAESSPIGQTMKHQNEYLEDLHYRSSRIHLFLRLSLVGSSFKGGLTLIIHGTNGVGAGSDKDIKNRETIWFAGVCQVSGTRNAPLVSFC